MTPTETVRREDLLSYISDAHKDAYGFRPSYWNLSETSTDELEAIADRMNAAVERRIEEDRRMQEAALADFEMLVASNIQLGAPDRETAIR